MKGRGTRGSFQRSAAASGVRISETPSLYPTPLNPQASTLKPPKPQTLSCGHRVLGAMWVESWCLIRSSSPSGGFEFLFRLGS